MKSLQLYISGIIILFLLAGCAQALNQPTSNLENTEMPSATASLRADPINTPTETITPIPPPTRRSTSTSLSNLTPTVTPLASFTRMPASKFSRTPTSTITGTNTLYVRRKYWWITATSTPIPYACTVIKTEPEWGKIYKPRTDFIAHWKLYNTGTNMWHVDDIIFAYVSDTKMQSPGRGDVYLSDTFSKNSVVNVQVHMRTPLEPGFYTATWGLRKSNKKEFFCTFTVSIRVQK